MPPRDSVDLHQPTFPKTEMTPGRWLQLLNTQRSSKTNESASQTLISLDADQLQATLTYTVLHYSHISSSFHPHFLAVVVSNWQELRHYLLSLGPISPSGFGLASQDCLWRCGWRRLRGGGGAVLGGFFSLLLNWISHHSNLGLEPGIEWELAFAFQPSGSWKAMLEKKERGEKYLEEISITCFAKRLACSE